MSAATEIFFRKCLVSCIGTLVLILLAVVGWGASDFMKTRDISRLCETEMATIQSKLNAQESTLSKVFAAVVKIDTSVMKHLIITHSTVKPGIAPTLIPTEPEKLPMRLWLDDAVQKDLQELRESAERLGPITHTPRSCKKKRKRKGGMRRVCHTILT